MTPPSRFIVIVQLVVGTFRQALASRLVVVAMFGGALVILLCASMGIEGGEPLRQPGDTELYRPDGEPLADPDPANGTLTLGFGTVRVPLFRDAPSMVGFLQALLAKWVAGAAGTLLVLVGTAGFLPEALRPQAAAVLLTKPCSRTTLLVGKSLGVLVFAAALACLFVGGTWLAIGLRTGIWPGGYLMSIPLLLLNFATLFGVSALIAVWTRSTPVCIVGTVALWLVCIGVNHGRQSVVAMPELVRDRAILASDGGASTAVEIGYWILPKPGDLAAVLDQAVDAGAHFAQAPLYQVVRDRGQFHPGWILTSSLLFIAASLALASWEFERLEY